MHDHASHRHQHSHTGAARRRVLWIALIANAVFVGVEVAGGIAFNSLALLADAGHMLSDVAGLALALIAQRLSERPRTSAHTYGLQRAEVLGALANAVLLLAAAAYISYEAIGRFAEPQEVEGAGLLIVATVGLAVNLGSALLLAREAGESLNMRGAVLHMALDAASSVAVIVAALAVIVADAYWVDPAASLLIAVMIVWSVWSLLRESLNVLLEGTPRNIDVDQVMQALAAQPGVRDVHHLHVWSLASDVAALSVHVVLDEGTSLHDAEQRAAACKKMLDERFQIAHATIEMECHSCEE